MCVCATTQDSHCSGGDSGGGGGGGGAAGGAVRMKSMHRSRKRSLRHQSFDQSTLAYASQAADDTSAS